MWFKNIILYRLSEQFTLTPEQLHDKLYSDLSRSCGKMEKTTFGWIPPLGKEHELLVHAINGNYLIAAKKEEKILPTTVIRDHVAEKIAQIEAAESRQVGAREKRNLMDEMSITLLPQAFTKSSTLYAYIDTQKGWLIVDSSSRNKAEELTVLLRKSLGSFKLALPEPVQKSSFIMTEWLKHQDMPTNFCIEDYCEMINPDAEATLIKCVNQDLFAKEVTAHVSSGKQVMKLAMSWHDRVSFIIDNELAIKRIKFLDLVQDQISDIAAETQEEQFDADFSIFSSEFAQMLPDIFELFGGLVDMKAVAGQLDETVA
ncbi:MAG: recombination-associated protein RdgC [Legionellales bacterium]|nr:recombination-associated protein RdgC [Legionellales bacterium]|tara:strand:- start:682 stop:1626 length:945 start_codon:yes stop_codon:yes gene_type:complete